MGSHSSMDWDGDERNEANQRLLKQLLGDRPSTGDAARDLMRKVAGEFPDGKLNESDEGALAFQVGSESGRVSIVFPKKVSWIAFSPDDAIQLALTLIKHARAIGIKKPFTMEL
jgi:hypothetical protein